MEVIIFKSISLKEAICFVRTAWNSVTKTTIINCWKHTKIIIINEKDLGNIKSIIEDNINSNIMELDDLLKDLMPNLIFQQKNIFTLKDTVTYTQIWTTRAF